MATMAGTPPTHCAAKASSPVNSASDPLAMGPPRARLMWTGGGSVGSSGG
ncbi:MAG: hypothetical protein IPJ94_31010 [Chloroflexi bacterium]|nr:hypothetical protein [Chloroflexota bacterium]